MTVKNPTHRNILITAAAKKEYRIISDDEEPLSADRGVFCIRAYKVEFGIKKEFNIHPTGTECVGVQFLDVNEQNIDWLIEALP